jgi:phosphoglycerol transferase MdoB-like AlkP superfamily enzyme
MDFKSNFTHFMSKSRFSIVALSLFIALPIFAVLRIALLSKQWAEIDSPFYQIIAAFLLGVMSDITFLSYFLIPFILYLWLMPQGLYQNRWQKGFIYLILFASIYALLFIIAAEWFFWDEFGVRFNFIAVDYLVYTTEVVQNIVESYPLPTILSVLFIISSLCFWRVIKYASLSFNAQETGVRKSKIALSLFLLPIMAFFAIEQSFHEFSSNKYLNELAANGPYQFFAAFKSSELDYRQFYKLADDQQLSTKIKQLVSQQGDNAQNKQLYAINRLIKKNGAEKRLNVILITVESLSAEYLKTFGNTENISPFMDEWFKEGLLFTNFYATGTRTIRGLEALTLSYPPTAGHSIVKRPDNSKLFNLGYVFNQHGYDTAFLYGGNGYFDNMNAFYAGNGFRIIDKSNLSKAEITFSNAWGVSDDVIFNRTMKEADADYKKQQPFFFQIMTTSNHRPYTYPAGKIDIPSGKGGRNGGVKFTDYAIHEFIQQAKNKPWFEDTVFVVVADHCGGSARKVELPVDRYHIPFFIYAPKHIQPQMNTTLSSQIDVAPTLLSLLNFSYESWFFGQDILHMKPEQGRALIGNYQKLGLFKDNKLAFLSVQQQVDVVLDPLGKHRAVKPETQAELVAETMAYYQAADYIWTHRLTRYK